MCKKKKRKFIGSHVSLCFGSNGLTKAKIVGIEFCSNLKKPVFHLVSDCGNKFRLTRAELKYYESADNRLMLRK